MQGATFLIWVGTSKSPCWPHPRRGPQKEANKDVQFPRSSKLLIARWEPQFVPEEVHLPAQQELSPTQQGELTPTQQAGPLLKGPFGSRGVSDSKKSAIGFSSHLKCQQHATRSNHITLPRYLWDWLNSYDWTPRFLSQWGWDCSILHYHTPCNHVRIEYVTIHVFSGVRLLRLWE